jgi:hypothetical protein
MLCTVCVGERGLPAGQAGANGGEQLLHSRGAAGHTTGAHRSAAPTRGASVREQVPTFAGGTPHLKTALFQKKLRLVVVSWLMRMLRSVPKITQFCVF